MVSDSVCRSYEYGDQLDLNTGLEWSWTQSSYSVIADVPGL